MSNPRKHPQVIPKRAPVSSMIRLPMDLERERRERLEREFVEQVQHYVEHDKNELAEEIRRRQLYRF